MSDWKYEPAGDVGLPAGEQWRSLARESGLPSVAANLAWTGLCGGYLRAAHGFRVERGELLPKRAPYVVVANHSSHLDAIVLAASLPRAHRSSAFPIAAGDTFFETKAAAAFAAMFLNALPMWRGKCGAHAMETLRARLIEGRSIYLLFPEGTRSRTGTMGKFRSGIGMLVAGTSVPIVPAWIDGAHAAMPPGARCPRRGTVRVRVGSPRDFLDVANDRAGWTQIAATLEAEVRALGAAD